MAERSGGWLVALLGFAAVMIGGYLALEHSGGLRTDTQALGGLAGRTGKAASGLVRTFQGR